MSNLLTWKLWFAFYPGPLLPLFQNILIGLTAAFLLLALFSSWKKRAVGKSLYAKIWESLVRFGIFGFCAGLFLLFTTSQSIGFFSARFWFVLWGIIHAVWGYYLYQRWQKIPAIQKEIEQRREFKKYVP